MCNSQYSQNFDVGHIVQWSGDIDSEMLWRIVAVTPWGAYCEASPGCRNKMRKSRLIPMSELWRVVLTKGMSNGH